MTSQNGHFIWRAKTSHGDFRLRKFAGRLFDRITRVDLRDGCAPSQRIDSRATPREFASRHDGEFRDLVCEPQRNRTPDALTHARDRRVQHVMAR